MPPATADKPPCSIYVLILTALGHVPQQRRTHLIWSARHTDIGQSFRFLPAVLPTQTTSNFDCHLRDEPHVCVSVSVCAVVWLCVSLSACVRGFWNEIAANYSHYDFGCCFSSWLSFTYEQSTMDWPLYLGAWLHIEEAYAWVECGMRSEHGTRAHGLLNNGLISHKRLGNYWNTGNAFKLLDCRAFNWERPIDDYVIDSSRQQIRNWLGYIELPQFRKLLQKPVAHSYMRP